MLRAPLSVLELVNQEQLVSAVSLTEPLPEALSRQMLAGCTESRSCSCREKSAEAQMLPLPHVLTALKQMEDLA
jgi:hypothetical protein